jgi:hypothetical protein
VDAEQLLAQVDVDWLVDQKQELVGLATRNADAFSARSVMAKCASWNWTTAKSRRLASKLSKKPFAFRQSECLG